MPRLPDIEKIPSVLLLTESTPKLHHVAGMLGIAIIRFGLCTDDDRKVPDDG
jgi:hypothetical protein